MAANYNPSPEIQKLWKEFGCDKSAGRLLRQIYDRNPAVIQYPKVKTRDALDIGKKPEPKFCPQQAYVKVPKFSKKATSTERLLPTGGKKSLDQIQEENELNRGPVLNPGPKGVNRQQMTASLQEKHTFGRGSALPKGAMGHGVPVAIPQKSLRKPAPAPQTEDKNDLSKEDDQLFDQIYSEMHKKQEELRQLQRNAMPQAKPANQHQFLREKKLIDKEMRRLQCEIQNDKDDLKKVLELTNKAGDTGAQC